MTIKAHLERLRVRTQEVTHGGQEEKEGKGLAGNFNNLRFKKARVPIRFRFKSKRPPIDIPTVAISTPLERHAATNVPMILKTHALMREHKIASPQIHQSMVITGKGVMISPAALSDLFRKIDGKKPKKIFNFKQLQNIFGQILIGVQAFHQQNIVHRDLKPENILLFESLNEKGELEYLVKICDHNSIIEVDPTTKQPSNPQEEFFGTLEFVAPEVFWADYGNLDLTKIDSYACGEILEQLLAVTQMTSEEQALGKQLAFDLKKWKFSGLYTKDLWITDIDPRTNKKRLDPKYDAMRRNCKDRLKRKEHGPETRLSIAEALQNPFFATQDKTPQKYSEFLTAEFAHDLEVDGEVVDPLRPVGDYRNLAPKEIKAIDDCLEKIDEEKPSLSEYQKARQLVDNALQNPQLIDYRVNLNAIRADLQEKIEALEKKVAEIQAEIAKQKVYVDELRCDLNAQKLEEIGSKKFEERAPIYSQIVQEFGQALLRHKRMPGLLQQTRQKIAADLSQQALSNSSDREKYRVPYQNAEKLRLKLVTPQTFLEAVEKAVKNFILSNNLSVKRMVVGSNTIQTAATRFVGEHQEIDLKNVNYTSYEKLFFFVPNPCGRHGQEGLERAAALYYEVKDLLFGATKSKNPLVHAHARVQKHFISGEGNWAEHSFKTLLDKELREVSTLNYQSWPAEFSPVPVM